MPITLPTETERRLTADERLGAAVAARRRVLEGKPQWFGRGKKWIPLQMLEPIMGVLRRALDRSGSSARLAQAATRLKIVERSAWLSGLPDELIGLRVLHLSDLHIDGVEGFGARLARCCAGLDFDIAVITGDLRLEIHGSIDRMLAEMGPLLRELTRRGPAFAVLGNHDSLDMVEPLESLGLRFLLNESATVERGGAVLHLAGVDDAHYFGTDDLERALERVPVDGTTILLCHSPDLIREAAETWVDLYLCGHTHGGQLCLPGGAPLVSNANCARRFSAGPWRYGSLAGYTSRGVGFSGLPLRSFCQAEIVLHVLQRERRNRCRLSLEGLVLDA